MVDASRQHIHPQHHPRAAAGGRIIDGAMLVDRKVADLDGIERPSPLVPCASGERDAERTGKHLGVESQDSGGESHRDLPLQTAKIMLVIKFPTTRGKP